MIPELEPVIYLFLIVTGVAALVVRDMLAAVVILTVYSFWMALLYAAMGAVDVGFTEAVVGAGVSGIFFLAALFKTVRRASD